HAAADGACFIEYRADYRSQPRESMVKKGISIRVFVTGVLFPRNYENLLYWRGVCGWTNDGDDYPSVP
ncbi:MAG: hypothetical protein ACI9DF_003611, partial [Verrucomicrobiales bacterium]